MAAIRVIVAREKSEEDRLQSIGERDGVGTWQITKRDELFALAA